MARQSSRFYPLRLLASSLPRFMSTVVLLAMAMPALAETYTNTYELPPGTQIVSLYAGAYWIYHSGSRYCDQYGGCASSVTYSLSGPGVYFTDSVANTDEHGTAQCPADFGPAQPLWRDALGDMQFSCERGGTTRFYDVSQFTSGGQSITLTATVTGEGGGGAGLTDSVQWLRFQMTQTPYEFRPKDARDDDPSKGLNVAHCTEGGEDCHPAFGVWIDGIGEAPPSGFMERNSVIDVYLEHRRTRPLGWSATRQTTERIQPMSRTTSSSRGSTLMALPLPIKEGCICGSFLEGRRAQRRSPRTTTAAWRTCAQL
jgi:hypothetical protein